MSLKRGFDATVTIGSGSGAKTLVTRGDVAYDESRTEIEVKNAAADEVRYVPGMQSTTFQITVQAGTDPEDTAGYDAYTELRGYYETGTTFPVTFTSPVGMSVSKNMIVTHWVDNDPVDGLNDATVDLRVSAGDASTPYFPTTP